MNSHFSISRLVKWGFKLHKRKFTWTGTWRRTFGCCFVWFGVSVSHLCVSTLIHAGTKWNLSWCHSVEFLSFFLFVFCSYGREESWPSLSQRDANLSLSLGLSVFCRRSAVTGRADCWRRAVWALFSTRYTHTRTLVLPHDAVTQHTNTQCMHMHELCLVFHPLLMNTNI